MMKTKSIYGDLSSSFSNRLDEKVRANRKNLGESYDVLSYNGDTAVFVSHKTGALYEYRETVGGPIIERVDFDSEDIKARTKAACKNFVTAVVEGKDVSAYKNELAHILSERLFVSRLPLQGVFPMSESTRKHVFNTLINDQLFLEYLENVGTAVKEGKTLIVESMPFMGLRARDKLIKFFRDQIGLTYEQARMLTHHLLNVGLGQKFTESFSFKNLNGTLGVYLSPKKARALSYTIVETVVKGLLGEAEIIQNTGGVAAAAPWGTFAAMMRPGTAVALGIKEIVEDQKTKQRKPLDKLYPQFTKMVDPTTKKTVRFTVGKVIDPKKGIATLTAPDGKTQVTLAFAVVDKANLLQKPTGTFADTTQGVQQATQAAAQQMAGAGNAPGAPAKEAAYLIGGSILLEQAIPDEEYDVDAEMARIEDEAENAAAYPSDNLESDDLDGAASEAEDVASRIRAAISAVGEEAVDLEDAELSALEAEGNELDAALQGPSCPCDSPTSLEGGVGDDLVIEDIDPEELEMGIQVELEHIKDNPNLSDEEKLAIATDIAKDHLFENPKYYSIYKASGLAPELDGGEEAPEVEAVVADEEPEVDEAIAEVYEGDDTPEPKGEPGEEIDGKELLKGQVGPPSESVSTLLMAKNPVEEEEGDDDVAPDFDDFSGPAVPEDELEIPPEAPVEGFEDEDAPDMAISDAEPSEDTEDAGDIPETAVFVGDKYEFKKDEIKDINTKAPLLPTEYVVAEVSDDGKTVVLQDADGESFTVNAIDLLGASEVVSSPTGNIDVGSTLKIEVDVEPKVISTNGDELPPGEYVVTEKNDTTLTVKSETGDAPSEYEVSLNDLGGFSLSEKPSTEGMEADEALDFEAFEEELKQYSEIAVPEGDVLTEADDVPDLESLTGRRAQGRDTSTPDTIEGLLGDLGGGFMPSAPEPALEAKGDIPEPPAEPAPSAAGDDFAAPEPPANISFDMPKKGAPGTEPDFSDPNAVPPPPDDIAFDDVPESAPLPDAGAMPETPPAGGGDNIGDIFSSLPPPVASDEPGGAPPTDASTDAPEAPPEAPGDEGGGLVDVPTALPPSAEDMPVEDNPSAAPTDEAPEEGSMPPAEEEPTPEPEAEEPPGEPVEPEPEPDEPVIEEPLPEESPSEEEEGEVPLETEEPPKEEEADEKTEFQKAKELDIDNTGSIMSDGTGRASADPEIAELLEGIETIYNTLSGVQKGDAVQTSEDEAPAEVKAYQAEAEAAQTLEMLDNLRQRLVDSPDEYSKDQARQFIEYYIPDLNIDALQMEEDALEPEKVEDHTEDGVKPLDKDLAEGPELPDEDEEL